jgi:hypothetical protein
MILLLGSPRSGTTWIGKILDSHPEVLYRHEPDIVLKNTALPFLPEPDELERHAPEARRYLEALARVRHPRAAGSQPQFPKSYRGPVSALAHRAFVYAGKAGEALAARLPIPPPPVPDLVRGQAAPVLAIKSVSSLGRARLFAEARPDVRIVHIVRHPCAQIASRLRGMRLGLLEGGTYLKSIAATSTARRLGLDLASLEAMTLEEQMAAQWLVLNQKVHEEMAGRPAYHLLDYDAFCKEPLAQARGLFGQLGLRWPEETRAFIEGSSQAQAGGRYFSLFRDSRAEPDKWRKELSPEQSESIQTVLSRVAGDQVIFRALGIDFNLPATASS